MGLDVYVGSLTRYYTGDWETVVQKYARENNLKLEIVRPGGTDPRPKQSREEVLPLIEEWRDSLWNGLSDHLKERLDWNEAVDSPYFTDKPAWDCYSALLALAANQEQPQYELPESADFDLAMDPSFKASTVPEFKTKFPNLLGPELWLPYQASFTFHAELAGKNISIGSTYGLLDELWMVNDKTYRGSKEDISAWLQEGGPKGAPFEIASRFALGIMLRLTESAVYHKLPMKLDY